MEDVDRLEGMTLHSFSITPKLRTSLKLIDHQIGSSNTHRFVELSFINPTNQEFSFKQLPVDIKKISCSTIGQQHEIEIKLVDKKSCIVCACEDVDIVFKNVI